MKNIFRRSFLIIALILITASLNIIMAQGPEPPPSSGSGPSRGHDLGGNQGASGDAALEDGIGISLLLVAMYGGFLLYKNRKKKKEISEINL